MENVSTLSPPMQVSFRGLLGLYLVIPACMLAFFIDKYCFGSIFQHSFPKAPEYYFYFTLLFGIPHIMASNFLLATNREYLRFFKWRLIAASAIIIAFLALGSIFLPRNAMFFFIATATIIHVVRQQLGIGNIVARLSGPRYEFWYWSVILASIVMYNDIFIGTAFTPMMHVVSRYTMMGFSVVIFVSACMMHYRLKDTLARGFLVGNTAMALVSFFLYSQDYYFFAILGPRVVHDTTAFIFYMAHDRNKHLQHPQNTFYTWMSKLSIHPFVAVPVVAILLTFVFQRYGDQIVQYPGVISIGFIGYLTYLHYYTESFTWKGVSPYRRYISFRR